MAPTTILYGRSHVRRQQATAHWLRKHIGCAFTHLHATIPITLHLLAKYVLTNLYSSSLQENPRNTDLEGTRVQESS